MLLARPLLVANFCPHSSRLQNSSTLSHATAILPSSIPRLRSLVKPARLLLRHHYSLSPKPVFITTPIFYVNAVPHVGHLYSAVLADVLRRYYELKGYKAFLSTGTDEHGMKIQQAAAKSNEKPILFCDKVSQRFRELFEAADISYTTFIRTTEKRHAVAVADLWKRLNDNGHIYKGKHEGWYAVSDEAFYADSQVHKVVDEKTGEVYMASMESGQRVEWMAEENYKFRLSAFQGKLLEWLESNPQVIVPKNRFNEVHSWIKSDLSDLSISRPRSRLDWGIPVPGDSDHTIYVWLDALTNYMTVTGYPWTEGSEWPAEYGAWPADVHLVGKDIIRFHAIYWPAFLMAAGLPLPRQIIAHSHWTMGKQKMSKSRGNVADPFEAMQKYGVDPIRYYLIRDGGIADDGDYSDGSITTRYRKDLAGQLGNLVSRSMADSLNPSGLVPQASEKLDTRDATLTDKLEKLSDIVDKYYEEREFNKATQAVFDTLAEANKHFTDNEPWNLVKDPQQSERLDTVLFFSVESTRLAGILLQPVMPTKMGSLLDRLGVGVTERTWADARYGAGWGGKYVKGGKRRMLGKMQGVLFPALKEKA